MANEKLAKDLMAALASGDAKKFQKSLADAQTYESHTADVVRHDGQILLPNDMSIDDAMATLKRRKEYEEQMVSVNREFNFFHLDGARALIIAIEEKYGWAEAADSFWNPPSSIQVQVSPTESVSVPWGKFELPNIKGSVTCDVGHKDQQHVFVLNAYVARKHEPEIKALGDRVAAIVAENSIYRGKALKINMDAENQHECGALPPPEFMDLSGVYVDELIFSEDVKDAIDTNVFTPVRNYEECKAAGIPFKRGVALVGPYGTGKTLAASVLAKYAVENNITFLYCESAEHLAACIGFSQQYGRAVVFCEDIDKVMAGERDLNMDDILNTVDGIESKSSEIMIVLTSNHPEKINPAMLRPGRLDAVIDVQPPDGPAVEKLIRLYGRGLVPFSADLTIVGEALSGQIPAVIREVVERAKLSAIRLKMKDEAGFPLLTETALLDAAASMNMQLALLNKPVVRKLSDMERAAMILRGNTSVTEDDQLPKNGAGRDLTGSFLLTGKKSA
jgi:transitional endoplasmic reticulum ATPase